MKFKLKYLILLFFSLILVPSFLFFSITNRESIVGFFRPFYSWTSEILSKPIHFASDIVNDSRSLLETFEENKVLKEKWKGTQELRAENDSLRQENKSLRASLELMEKHKNTFHITADVSSRLSPTWTSKLVVSKGKFDGVTKQMLVLANGGVIGIVASVSSESSIVQLLSDVNFAQSIPVKVQGKVSNYGVLSDYDAEQNVFRIKHFSEAEELAIGQEVVTSDLSDTYPSNIFIGKITAIIQNSDTLEQEVLVEPSADFSRIYSVVIVGKE